METRTGSLDVRAVSWPQLQAARRWGGALLCMKRWWKIGRNGTVRHFIIIRPMATSNPDFAQYCCELMAVVGPCRAKRMFGGWGISTDGLTIAIVANLGAGDTLWIKADDASRTQFEAEGCARFIYEAKGKSMGMNYYSAPADAMESPALMAPWARMALQSALVAANAKAAKASRAARPAKTTKAAKAPEAAKATTPTTPRRSR